jgi:hypothetical protein
LNIKSRRVDPLLNGRPRPKLSYSMRWKGRQRPTILISDSGEETAVASTAAGEVT